MNGLEHITRVAMPRGLLGKHTEIRGACGARASLEVVAVGWSERSPVSRFEAVTVSANGLDVRIDPVPGMSARFGRFPIRVSRRERESSGLVLIGDDVSDPKGLRVELPEMDLRFQPQPQRQLAPAWFSVSEQDVHLVSVRIRTIDPLVMLMRRVTGRILGGSRAGCDRPRSDELCVFSDRASPCQKAVVLAVGLWLNGVVLRPDSSG